MEKYLLFEAGGRQFSVSFADILQIIAAEEPSPLPDFPDYVLGTIAFDGSVIPVISLRRRFHYEDKPVTDRNCIIVALSEDKRVGLLCDSVAGFTELNDSDIMPPTDLNEEASARFLRGEILLGERHILLLDPIKLIKLGDEAVFQTADPEEGKEDTEQ
ncbi:MAG: purine-binding chemotaxis protein CheW [Ruminococcus sp.]|nr:purine-binding chemotaxis protein CheW [Ruminococcus sp.]